MALSFPAIAGLTAVFMTLYVFVSVVSLLRSMTAAKAALWVTYALTGVWYWVIT